MAVIPRKTKLARTSQTFISGVLGILPAALTFAVFAWLVVFLHDLAGPNSAFGSLLRGLGMSVTACEVTAYSLGLLGTTLLVYVVGVLVENGAAMRWNSAIDGAVKRIPFVSTVYDASKNLSSVFDRKTDSIQGMLPVMCYFSDDATVGSPALLPTSERICIDEQEYHIVIIPSAPVPFGGALLCVKAAWVKPVDCSFDELIGVYMSLGASAPECLNNRADKFGSPPIVQQKET